MHPFTEYLNPYLGDLLQNMAMDKSFVRGDGCHLYDESGNRYLDCIAAYGALPFGHNPPEIWEAVTGFRISGEPNFVQPSYLDAAGLLAKGLVETAPPGLRYVTFTNSGAEAVEAALKLCRAATGRKGILAADNSFHGKTLGALSATGNSAYQAPFGTPVEGFDFVKYGDPDALEAKFAAAPRFYAAFIAEPIQGEGGIVVPPTDYLSRVKEICARYGVLLVVDEIQTGLGRTGRLFACEEEGVTPDLLLLAKALGGGLVPIGACLSTAEAYSDLFALKHSSTFAGNSLACRVGLRVLEQLTADNGALLHQVQKRGLLLKEGLYALQEKYPHLISAVRGRGLMLGLELSMERRSYPGSLLGFAAEQELLAPALSAYLLNRERIRVAPTLNGGAVIRIEPPLIITDAQCRRALEGISAAMAVLNEANTARFFSFLVTDKSELRGLKEQFSPGPPAPGGAKTAAGGPVPAGQPEQAAAAPTAGAAAAFPGAGRFAFLLHPLDLQSYSQFDKSLLLFNEDELARLAKRWSSLMEPYVISRVDLVSKEGGCARGEFIVIPRTAVELSRMPREKALQELRKAMNLARAGGAGIVGLGAYTAVVSMGGLYLKDEKIPLTTGNSYTVVSAAEAVGAACGKLGILPQGSTVAVIGGAGSIGKGVALLLSESAGGLILVGNPHSKKKACGAQRMWGVAAEIYRYLARLLQGGRLFPCGSMGDRLSRCAALPSPEASLQDFVDFARSAAQRGGPIRVALSAKEGLGRAGIVISATSSREKLIGPGDLQPGAVVCDISRPPNVSEAVENERPDVLVIDGGVVELPGRPDLGWDFGFPPGLAYACMAETMMLALERRYEHFSLGSSGVNLDSILQTRRWAGRHGFKLADLRSFDRPLSKGRWEQLLAARREQKTAVSHGDSESRGR